jgi:hypothetical protein
LIGLILRPFKRLVDLGKLDDFIAPQYRHISLGKAQFI